jgi:hypothetical protein
VTPTCKVYDHAIELNPGATLPRLLKLYPLNPVERTSLNEWIKDKLAKGYIKPSKSPTAAPVFFVKKKDGSLRLVQDYRTLNAVTKKNKFPIPRISDLVSCLLASSIFMSMDLRWGFNNVRIQEGDKEKAAFITPKGLFEPTVMYQVCGLRNYNFPRNSADTHRNFPARLRPFFSAGIMMLYEHKS